jgi:NADH-ubiquinone oxidoreductase chain 1
MIYSILYYFLEILTIIVPILLSVAFITIVERKILASMQRRVGPNIVGFYGILQPFADALKLIMKETVMPSQASPVFFYIAPSMAIIFSLLGWIIIPLGPGLALVDLELGVLYILAISSIGVYGGILAGWSANNKYAFIGGLRSTAQMISYELILGSAVLTVLIISGTINFSAIVENQSAIWYIVPLAPIFILWIISVLAETNRTPFDNVEAESELVAGFFTEHGAMPFVLFFLAEYSSIVLISALTATLFWGGWSIPEMIINNSPISISVFILGFKTCLACFGFVWFRATLPRLRWDVLINSAWTQILPLAIIIVLFVPSIIVTFDIII